MSITVVILFAALTILSVFAILLHILGLYLLHKPNPLEVNQKLYLIQMSILEIMLVACQNITIYLKIFVNNSSYQGYASLITYAVGLSWNNIMIMLTVDRFLQVYLNIKYVLYVTERRTKIIIFFCYLVGICFGILLIALNLMFNIGPRIMHSYFYPIYGTIGVIIFSVTYLYIYKRIRVGRMPQKVQSTNHGKSRHRGIFVPFWIMVTFITFILVPSTIFVFAFDTPKYEKYTRYIWRLLWSIGFIADALIYIIFNKPIRKIFLRLIDTSINRE